MIVGRRLFFSTGCGNFNNEDASGEACSRVRVCINERLCVREVLSIWVSHWSLWPHNPKPKANLHTPTTLQPDEEIGRERQRRVDSWRHRGMRASAQATEVILSMKLNHRTQQYYCLQSSQVLSEPISRSRAQHIQAQWENVFFGGHRIPVRVYCLNSLTTA